MKEPCRFCGFPLDYSALGKYGCPNCEGAKPAKRGPKPLHGENMQAFHFRMTKAQREKLDRLGGVEWMRQQIEKAKELN